MAFQFSDLWRFDGRVSRAKYAAAGFIGVAIKHNIDRLIAASFLGYKNSFFNYWAPLGKAARLDHLSSTEAKFLATLLLTSIPFLWVGVTMTVKRLRDAGQPVWLVVLFFVPFINVLFFLMLCALPPQERSADAEGAPWPGPGSLSNMIPRSPLGSAVRRPVTLGADRLDQIEVRSGVMRGDAVYVPGRVNRGVAAVGRHLPGLFEAFQRRFSWAYRKT
jgi:uncharacterized membrane protein YhaH (DUF805 family)